MQSSIRPATIGDSHCQKRRMRWGMHPRPPQALTTADASLAQVGCIYHALAVWRKIWTSLPVRFLVMDLVGLGTRIHLDLPESTSSVNVPAIRDEQYFRAIPCPYRTYLVIGLAVVIARQHTDGLRSKLPHIVEQPIFK